ncbi:MAG: alpha/beta fold hydrolase [Bdellovibrionota bacterium]
MTNTQTPKDGEIRNLVYPCPVDHNGFTINIIGWKVEGSVKPPLIFAHDIGESIERYTALAMKLAEAGYSVYAFDMRGHGHSGKKIEDISSFSLLVNDLLQVVAFVKFKEESRRPIIIARGMGALIALTFTKMHKKFVSGVVFASPMFNLNYNLTPLRRFLIRTVADVLPSISLPRWLSPAFTNASQETYVMDPNKIHPKMSSHFTFELLNYVGQSRKLLRRLNLPTLLICPENDPALRYEFLKPLVQRHSHSDKFTLKFVKGEDNLPLEHGGNTLKYLSSTIISWLGEVADRQKARSQGLIEIAKEKKGPTIVSEATTDIKPLQEG